MVHHVKQNKVKLRDMIVAQFVNDFQFNQDHCKQQLYLFSTFLIYWGFFERYISKEDARSHQYNPTNLTRFLPNYRRNFPLLFHQLMSYDTDALSDITYSY